MTDKLKNCPFCGGKAIIEGGYVSCDIVTGCGLGTYDNITLENWQNRPVEKYLRDWLEAIDSGLTLPAQEEIEQLKARITELEAKAEPEWIPVSERLPECEKKKGAQSERVACLTNLFERTIGWVDWNTYIKGYTWDWVKDTIYGYSDEIIAWYPLPPVKVQP